MYPLGLTAAEWTAYSAAIRAHHSIRISVDVLTTDHVQVATLDQRIASGQVNGDESAQVTRSATIRFFDPRHSMHFDSDSPADGALYADRMLRIRYGIRPPGGAWVDCPIFTGPVTKFARNAEFVDVECQGKELLALGAAWRTRTYKKRTLKRDVLINAVQNEGEQFFSFPEFSSRLPAHRSITRDTVPWDFWQAIAKSVGRQLYYDGWGRLRLRNISTRSMFTFNKGDGGEILTPPAVTFSIDNVKNIVQVIGAIPKHQKQKIRWTEAAPASHPLSPWKLGRNGQPRYLLETIEDSSIRSVAEAKSVARARLKVLLLQNVDIAFDSLVVPFLDLGDHFTTKTDDFALNSRLSSFSIPLTADGVMSVGYIRRQHIRKGRIR